MCFSAAVLYNHYEDMGILEMQKCFLFLEYKSAALGMLQSTSLDLRWTG